MKVSTNFHGNIHNIHFESGSALLRIYEDTIENIYLNVHSAIGKCVACVLRNLACLFCLLAWCAELQI